MSHYLRIKHTPSEIIESILLLLSPRDLAAMSAVGNREIQVLADSDIVWSRFFPPDMKGFMARLDEVVVFHRLKDFYHRLATHPLTLDHGTLIFSGDRKSGKNSYMIGAQSLGIVNPDNFIWHTLADSRFAQVATRMHAGDLSFHCRLGCSLLSDYTHYGAYLVFQIANEAHGLQSELVNVGMAYIDYNIKDPYIDEYDDGSFIYFDVGEEIEEDVIVPAPRDDAWMEVLNGRFFVIHALRRDIYITLAGDGIPPMDGLIFEGIEVRPLV